jgi:hypothetical protein
MARSYWVASALALFVLTNVVRFAANQCRGLGRAPLEFVNSNQGRDRPTVRVRTSHVASSASVPRSIADDDRVSSQTKIVALEDQINELTAYVERVLNETRRRQQPPRRSAPPDVGPSLPECDELMQRQNSPYRDGVFLTSHATKIQWVPRADGSRQLELGEICRLKRYTSSEANQCLADKHLSMIGDSLTRYQFTSLAYFLENGRFQSRFGRPPSRNAPCLHIDETGQPTCAPFATPSVTNHYEWKGGWNGYFRGLGGGNDGGVMNGHMESTSVRAETSIGGQDSDNFLYTHPKSGIVLSYAYEAGWGNAPRPLQGYYYTNCSYTGSCRKTKKMMRELANRSLAKDFDWQQSFPEAIGKNGTLRTVLPRRPDYLFYNRGVWGRLSEARAKLIMPALRDWVAGGEASVSDGGGDDSQDDGSGDDSQDEGGGGDDSQEKDEGGDDDSQDDGGGDDSQNEDGGGADSQDDGSGDDSQGDDDDEDDDNNRGNNNDAESQTANNAADDSQSHSSPPSPDRRCFYKTTTAGSNSMRGGYRTHELQHVWPHVYRAGCSYFDAGHLTDAFSALNWDDHMNNEASTERRSIYTDSVRRALRATAIVVLLVRFVSHTRLVVKLPSFSTAQVHFQPWVYEELNQVMLNVLCNDKKLA